MSKFMSKFNQRTAIAFHFGCDSKDIEWYQPAAGQKTRIFASGDKYFCATRKGQAPPKGYGWREAQDAVLKDVGWTIWECDDWNVDLSKRAHKRAHKRA